MADGLDSVPARSVPATRSVSFEGNDGVQILGLRPVVAAVLCCGGPSGGGLVRVPAGSAPGLRSALFRKAKTVKEPPAARGSSSSISDTVLDLYPCFREREVLISMMNFSKRISNQQASSQLLLKDERILWGVDVNTLCPGAKVTDIAWCRFKKQILNASQSIVPADLLEVMKTFRCWC